MTASLFVGVAAGCWRDLDPGTCNDGHPDDGEECDDGRDNQDPDTAAPGKCTWLCELAPGCGDKKPNTGEECDGGRTGSEWCTHECKRKPGCGNDFLDEGEECDLGPDNQPIESAAEGDCTTVSCKYAGCGNGQLEMGEECDYGDANVDSMNATADDCTLQCKHAVCGDGEKNKDEVCDDGNLDDKDGCPNRCSCEDRCGNRITESVCGEECDRGPDGDNNCTANCRNHICGDGLVGGSEECDEGTGRPPVEATEGQCTDLCSRAKCGDGHQNADEECDDGNDQNLDSCRNECLTSRIIFLSENDWEGRMLGGLTGADEKCQDEARDAELPGTYQAWLSDSRSSPKSRFNSINFIGWYVLPESRGRVADGWTGLTSDKTDIKEAIIVHADGTTEDNLDEKVWTNTKASGDIASESAHCGNWNDPGSTGKAIVGWAKEDIVNTKWSFYGDNENDLRLCNSVRHLYCVGQE